MMRQQGVHRRVWIGVDASRVNSGSSGERHHAAVSEEPAVSEGSAVSGRSSDESAVSEGSPEPEFSRDPLLLADPEPWATPIVPRVLAELDRHKGR